METNAKAYITAGVALVGAGVIAASPIAPPAGNSADETRSHEVSLLAATTDSGTQQEIAAALDLLQGGNPLALLEAFIEGTLEAFSRPAPVPYTPVTGLVDGLSHIGEGFAATGLRFGNAVILTPLGFVELASAIASGDTGKALAVVENFVDGPLWVLDPALYNLRDALPAPLGGEDGLIQNFRDGIWMITQMINDALAGADMQAVSTQAVSAAVADPGQALQGFFEGILTAFAQPGPVPYTPVDGPIDGLSRIAQGVIATGLRLAAATVLTPVGVVELASAIVQGDAEGAFAAVENIIDGPLWVADPLLYGLRDALPGPLGGEGALVEQLRNGVWAVTEQINAAIRSVVEPIADQIPVAPFAATDKFTGAEANSVPNRQSRVLTLNQELPQANLDSQGSGASPADDLPTTPPKLTKDEQQTLTRNVVRQSLNFSPSASETVSQKATGEGVDEEAASTDPSSTNSPAPTDDNDEGDASGGSEQSDSENQGGDK